MNRELNKTIKFYKVLATACEDALKLFEEELIWYFNEYQEMLY